MQDGRKNNGGHSTAGFAGRKSKEVEERIKGLSINALVTTYGSEEKAFEYLGNLSKESFPHLKLLIEYAYGKPKESIALSHEMPKPARKHFKDFSKLEE